MSLCTLLTARTPHVLVTHLDNIWVCTGVFEFMFALRFLAFASRFCDTGWYWPESRSVAFDWNDWPGTLSTSSSSVASSLLLTGFHELAHVRPVLLQHTGRPSSSSSASTQLPTGFFELAHVRPAKLQHTGRLATGFHRRFLIAPLDHTSNYDLRSCLVVLCVVYLFILFYIYTFTMCLFFVAVSLPLHTRAM